MSAAKKKGNGHDPATVELIELLRAMYVEMKATNMRLDGLTARVEGVAVRLDGLTARVETLHEDFLALRADVRSLDNEVRGLRVEMRADLHDLHETLEARIARLEHAVFKQAG